MKPLPTRSKAPQRRPIRDVLGRSQKAEAAYCTKDDQEHEARERGIERLTSGASCYRHREGASSERRETVTCEVVSSSSMVRALYRRRPSTLDQRESSYSQPCAMSAYDTFFEPPQAPERVMTTILAPACLPHVGTRRDRSHTKSKRPLSSRENASSRNLTVTRSTTLLVSLLFLHCFLAAVD